MAVAYSGQTFQFPNDADGNAVRGFLPDAARAGSD
jgi:hypothetical protein